MVGPLGATRENYELVKSVVEDLEQLRSSWTMSTSSAHLRRESALLRRLLVDGDYSKAWRIIGLPKSPLVRAPDLNAVVNAVERRYLTFAFAPSPDWMEVPRSQIKMRLQNPTTEGDLIITSFGKGLSYYAAFLIVPAAELTFVTNRETFAQSIAQGFGEQTSRFFWLDGYLDSAAAIFYDEVVTRREVIKYVANTLGGAHFGKSEKFRSKRVRELLDPEHVRVDERPAVYLELLSIGRVLADSTDAYRLSEEFRKLPVPPHPFDA